MRLVERTCETCAYCSLAGNCDRYDKPLTSVEQPSCNGYEIHPLLAENAKLRELVNDMWICISHGSEGWDCTGCRRDPDNVCIMGISEFSQRMRELGVKVDDA